MAQQLSLDTNVLHVLAPGQIGGLEHVVAMLSHGQQSRGVHVAAVLTPSNAVNHPFLDRLEILGVPATPIIVAGRSYVREYRCLSKLVDHLRPAVIHTHGYRADVIAGAVARGHRIPAVSTVHGFTGSGKYTRIYERVQCLALRHADAVIAVSRPLINRLARAGVPSDKIHYAPNGFAPVDQTLTRAAAREKLGIHPDALVAAWVGRLSHEKGPDVMLSAIAESDPSWHLCMIGDGVERDKLREQAMQLNITNRVTWHGVVSGAGSLLTAFDALVLSSRSEGTPIVLLEAMHASVPIIATRVGGVPDVLATEHALLVPPEDPQRIAQALEEIADGRRSAELRCGLARARLLDSFSLPEWLATVDAVYHQVRQIQWQRQREIGWIRSPRVGVRTEHAPGALGVHE